MIRVLAASAVALAACAPSAATFPAPAPRPPSPSATGAAPNLRFDIQAVDRHADPCVDFYDFACGGWRASHPLPPDKTRWSRYAELDAQNLERERDIVERAATSGASGSPLDQRVGGFYAACLDVQGIEARGLAPLQELLSSIDAIRSPHDVAVAIANLHLRASYVLFDLDVGPDPRDTGTTQASLDTGSLGMGDPEAYRRADERSATLRSKYAEHVAAVMKLIGSVDPVGDAQRVVSLETRLAASLPPAAARRDSDSRIHPMTPSEIAARAPAFEWTTYFASVGLPPVERLPRLNVAFPSWLLAMSTALASGSLDDLRPYLRYHAANGLKASLPRAVDDAFFDFQQRTLRGAREAPPRWKRCLGMVNRALGDDVGRLFVARYFSADSREKATQVVHAVAATFRKNLATVDWLSPAARAAAVEKLNHHRFHVGYPDQWNSYDSVVVRRDDPVGNAERARMAEVARELGLLGRPTDRDEFGELVQSVEGFGSKPLVSTGFTAGFLQPPVFDPTIDDAVTYGSFAAVAGHELTHQFDDEGRKYDVDGNVRAWWSAEDVARYEERARCVTDEYGRFHIEDGTAVDGKLTLGENIADNGGIRLAWETAHPSGAGPAIDGFTAAQRFFLAWGQIRCENATPEAARRQVESDAHAPGRFRVDGVVENMPEFAEAFACKAGAPMAPVARCRVW